MREEKPQFLIYLDEVYIVFDLSIQLRHQSGFVDQDWTLPSVAHRQHTLGPPHSPTQGGNPLFPCHKILHFSVEPLYHDYQ